MGLNGSRGRAKALAAIRKRLLTEARAAGVDVTDRKAVQAYSEARSRQIMTDIAARMARLKAARK